MYTATKLIIVSYMYNYSESAGCKDKTGGRSRFFLRNKESGFPLDLENLEK